MTECVECMDTQILIILRGEQIMDAALVYRFSGKPSEVYIGLSSNIPNIIATFHKLTGEHPILVIDPELYTLTPSYREHLGKEGYKAIHYGKTCRNGREGHSPLFFFEWGSKMNISLPLHRITCFTRNSLSIIRELINENIDYEVAGHLTRRETNNMIIWDIKVDRSFEGANALVSTEKPYTFHTHPLGIYNKYGTSFGTPSGNDMRFIFKNTILAGTRIHFLLTGEGIYEIKLNPDLASYARDNLSSDRVIKISLEIQERYVKLEGLRIGRGREISKESIQSLVTFYKESSSIRGDIWNLPPLLVFEIKFRIYEGLFLF